MKHILCLTLMALTTNGFAQDRLFGVDSEGRTPSREIFRDSDARDYDVAFDPLSLAYAADREATFLLDLPGGRPEKMRFRYLTNVECCFDLNGQPDPEAPLEKFTFTWVGKGEFDTDIIIVVRHGVATGTIVGEYGAWQLFNDRSRNTTFIRHIDQSVYMGEPSRPDERGKQDVQQIPALAESGQADQKPTPSPGAQKDNLDQFKVLIVYTDTARVQASFDANGMPPDPMAPTTDINAVITNSIESMNVALLNSGLPGARVVLAGSQQVSYNEATASGLPQFERYPAHLQWARTNSGVTNLRNSTEADMVAMLVDDDAS